jgi:hypothetical protein
MTREAAVMGEPYYSRDQHIAAVVLWMALLAGVTAVVVLYLLFMAGAAALDTGWCIRDPSQPTCSGGTPDFKLVVLLPIVGGFVGLLVGVIGGVVAISQYRKPYLWIALAVALAVAACVVAFVILKA